MKAAKFPIALHSKVLSFMWTCKEFEMMIQIKSMVDRDAMIQYRI